MGSISGTYAVGQSLAMQLRGTVIPSDDETDTALIKHPGQHWDLRASVGSREASSEASDFATD